MRRHIFCLLHAMGGFSLTVIHFMVAAIALQM